MKYKKDILLIAACVCAGCFIACFLFFTSSRGTSVVVRVQGQEAASFDLSKDTTYVIQGVDGGTNTLVISEEQAWLTEATCPDKLCEGMGKISKGGQSIVCLPNQVVVEIRSKDSDVDQVTQ